MNHISTVNFFPGLNYELKFSMDFLECYFFFDLKVFTKFRFEDIYPGSLVGVSTPDPFGLVTAISACPLPCGPFILTNSHRVCGPAPLNNPNVIRCANFELMLDC